MMKHLFAYNSFLLEQLNDSDFVHYKVDPSQKEVIIRNDTIGSNAKLNIKPQPLTTMLDKMGIKDDVAFAMNCALMEEGGENTGAYNFLGKNIKKANNQTDGNFGMHSFDEEGKRNAVLFTKSKKSPWDIVPTESWDGSGYYAIQNGPILLYDGKINPKFKPESTNLQSFRNGIGLDPSGNLHFVMALKPTSFYQFSKFLMDKGCKKAIFCDANISQCYINGGFKGAQNPVGPIIMVMK